jgi:hypothetical protein
MNRGVSRCLNQRRRLKIFNFFRPLAAAVKKLLGNRRRRLKNFHFFFDCRRRRLENVLFLAAAAEIF